MPKDQKALNASIGSNMRIIRYLESRFMGQQA
jgi:hypothetical protein